MLLTFASISSMNVYRVNLLPSQSLSPAVTAVFSVFCSILRRDASVGALTRIFFSFLFTFSLLLFFFDSQKQQKRIESINIHTRSKPFK